MRSINQYLKEAKSKVKIRAQWTPELAQDLNAYHAIDAEAELTAILSEQIAAEINSGISNLLDINHNNTDVPNNIFLPNNYLGVGENIGSVLRITNLPNTPIGLTEGSVWRDSDGFLRIV